MITVQQTELLLGVTTTTTTVIMAHVPGRQTFLDFAAAIDEHGSSDNWNSKTCKITIPSVQHLVALQAKCPSCWPTNSV